MAVSKRIALALSVFALSLCMVGLIGCSNQSATTNVEQEAGTPDIEVTASGATIQKKNGIAIEEGNDNVATVHYAFTIENHREGMVANNVTFNLAGYDENDEILFRGGSVLECAYPGVPTVVTGVSGMDAQQAVEGPVTRVEVLTVMSDVEWSKCELTDSELQNLFTVENEEATGENDILTVTATVTGDMADASKLVKTTSIENDLLGAHCVVLLYDSEGNIMMGSEPSSVLIDQEFLDKVKVYESEKGSNPETAAPINLIASIDGPPDFDRYELYVMPGLA